MLFFESSNTEFLDTGSAATSPKKVSFQIHYKRGIGDKKTLKWQVNPMPSVLKLPFIIFQSPNTCFRNYFVNQKA